MNYKSNSPAMLVTALTHLVCFCVANGVVPEKTMLAQELQSDGKRIEIINPLTKLKDAIEISPEILGPIKMLAVTEGSRVQKGELLAQIKNDRAALRLEQARFELQFVEERKASEVSIKVAEKTSAVASAEFTRAEQANRRVANTYAIAEIERLKLVFEKSLLEIEQAKHEQKLIDAQILIERAKVQLAELEVSQHRIACPVDGLVVKVNKQQGEWIEPGNPLLELIDLEAFRVEGFVSVQDAVLDLQDLPATVSLKVESEDWVHRGKVVFVSPEANPVNSQVRVILEFPFMNEEGRRKFRAGLKCNVWIDLSGKSAESQPDKQD